MAVEVSDSTPVKGVDDLAAWLAAGAKDKSKRRIGTEHEKFIFHPGKTAPVPYEPDGIGALLANLNKDLKWDEVIQDGRLTGLTNGAASVSLEPGGQFELSGAPLENLHQMSDELDAHISALKRAMAPLSQRAIGLGYWPAAPLADMPQMPKKRYDIMRAYMPTVGTLGLEMMHMTSTVQANLDFTSERDMARMMRVSMALQPIITALFAASPFGAGKANGFKSFRAEIWRHTDKARCGVLPFVFDDGFGFADYVNWAIDVPLYFVKRGDIFHEAKGATFRDLLIGKMAGFEATIADFANHIGTLFPDVRLKQFIEMRGADCGPADHIKALPALWTGLFYGNDSDAALDLVRDWSAQDVEALTIAVPKSGMDAKIKGRLVSEVVRDVVALARAGLRTRGVRNAKGADETVFIDILEERALSGKSLSDRLLQHYHGAWGERVTPLFEDYVY